ncbi:MAG: hypothetical protein ABI332_15740 [Polyangiaceae bacterium]
MARKRAEFSLNWPITFGAFLAFGFMEDCMSTPNETKPSHETSCSNPNASSEPGTPLDAPPPPHREPGKEPNPAEGQTERKHDVKKDA